MEDKYNQYISLSYDEIRNELVKYAKYYLDLKDADFSKTSLVSYIINSLSTLTFNNLLYSSLVYRENFLLTAQLPSSVYNLVEWIGYDVPLATPARIDVVFGFELDMRLGSTYYVHLPYNYRVFSNDIPYTLYSDLHSGLDTEYYISIRVEDGIVKIVDSRYNNISYWVDHSGSRPVCYFKIPMIQRDYNFYSFRIPFDLKPLQFYTESLKLSGYLENIQIYVIPSDELVFPLYSVRDDMGNRIEVNGVQDINSYDKFLMVFNREQRDRHLWRLNRGGLYTLHGNQRAFSITYREGDHIDIHFGNGVLGRQPIPGSYVFVLTSETRGSQGNIIPNAIQRYDKIFVRSGNHSVVEFRWHRVYNSGFGHGGQDLLSIEEIKSNAIERLRTNNRIVSLNDHSELLMRMGIRLESIYSLVKRNDLKHNETMVFLSLQYHNLRTGLMDIIPVRNYNHTITSSSPLQLITGQVFNIHGLEYVSLFDIDIDLDNSVARYKYIVNNVRLNTTYYSDNLLFYYLFSINHVNVRVNRYYNGDLLVRELVLEYEVDHKVDDDDSNAVYSFYLYTSFMNNQELQKILVSEVVYDSDNTDKITGLRFKYTNFLEIPEGMHRYYLEIVREVNGVINRYLYYFDLVAYLDLTNFMLSNVLNLGNNTYMVFDIPVILKEYYDSIDKHDFELYLLFEFLDKLHKINDYKMLNNFINIKFCNTTGYFEQMRFNRVDYEVCDYNRFDYTNYNFNNGDAFIVTDNEVGVNAWHGHKDEIAIRNDLVQGGWVFIKPWANMVCKVVNSNSLYNGLVLVSDGCRWYPVNCVHDVVSVLTIPLKIVCEIEVDSLYNADVVWIIDNLKDTIINGLSDCMGISKELDRSRIIHLGRSAAGIKNFRLLEPVIDIRYTFDIDKLSLSELQRYTPDYLGLSKDLIEVIVKV